MQQPGKHQLQEVHQRFLLPLFFDQSSIDQAADRLRAHKYSRKAVGGADVPAAWNEVNFAISNLYRELAAQREHEMAKTMPKHLFEICRMNYSRIDPRSSNRLVAFRYSSS